MVVPTIRERNRVAVIISNKPTSGVHGPPFNTDAEITVEKIFGIHTAAPSVVAINVAVISRIVPGKKVSTPNTDVELVIGVPLRTRRRRHLLHLFSAIGFSTGEGDRCDRPDGQQTPYEFFHLFLLLVKFAPVRLKAAPIIS